MKYRESGMPAEDYWEQLLHVPQILDRFGFGPDTGEVAELGCGYGTFTVPLARRIGGPVQAFDIDPAMVARTRERAAAAGLTNVRAECRDVFHDGFGLRDGSCDAVLLFNIVHGEQPVTMLREAGRVLRHGGVLAVIHWRSDVVTPRGPSAEIRPKAPQILEWASTAGGLVVAEPPFLLPPWHYGVKLTKAPAEPANVRAARGAGGGHS